MGKNMGERTILIIDDEEGLSETIKMMLEGAGGYKVVTASNGKEGVKLANMIKPDLILMDIMMPEMNGIQALKILKESTSTMGIPVVMLTAANEDIYKVQASQLYDEDYIIKPVHAQELIDRVEKIFMRRKTK